MVAANVSSCNFRFPFLWFPAHGSFFNGSPGDKGIQGVSLSFIYSDPVLHVVLSSSTFRHALPSEDVLYLG